MRVSSCSELKETSQSVARGQSLYVHIVRDQSVNISQCEYLVSYESANQSESI
jgi:hypothetical protein